MEYPLQFKYKSVADVIYTAKVVDGKLVITWDDNGEEKNNPLFTFAQAERFVADGLWIVQKPELVFPFKFKVGDYDQTIYTATLLDGKPAVSWYNDTENYDGYSLAFVENAVESGDWVVQKPVEASPEPSQDGDTLTIQVASTDALKAIKELTEAVNNLTAAYERLNKVQQQFMEVKFV